MPTTLTRRAFAGLATASPLLARSGVATAAAGAAPSGRRSEVEALRQFAESTHPRGAQVAAQSGWRDRWQRLAASADTLSDGDYYLRTRRALGWFRDGHTTVLPFEFVGGVPQALADGPFSLQYPIKVRVFDDGARVIATDRTARPLLGRHLLRVGERPVTELINEFAVDWPGNDAWAQRWSGSLFSSPALLQAMGALRDPNAPVSFEARAEDGRAAIVELRAAAPGELTESLTERRPLAQETWARAAGGGNYVHVLPDHEALYVSIDEMADVDGKTFEALTREVFAALAAPGVSRIVIDLRRNGGGDNFKPEALRRRLIRDSRNRPGGLCVLIGSQTFSAAQNFATRLERDTYAIYVGGPTGGAPNHYGDAKLFTGSVTGLTSMVSTLPWFDSFPQDERPWILPDRPVPERFDDWLAGRDPALDAALTLTDERPADDWSRELVLYFKRASQREGWRSFWRESAP